MKLLGCQAELVEAFTDFEQPFDRLRVTLRKAQTNTMETLSNEFKQFLRLYQKFKNPGTSFPQK